MASSTPLAGAEELELAGDVDASEAGSDPHAWADSSVARHRIAARYVAAVASRRGAAQAVAILTRCKPASVPAVALLAGEASSLRLPGSDDAAVELWTTYATSCRRAGDLGSALCGFANAGCAWGLRACAQELVVRMLIGSAGSASEADGGRGRFQAVTSALDTLAVPQPTLPGVYPLPRPLPGSPEACREAREASACLDPQQRVAAAAMRACPALAFAVALHDWLGLLGSAADAPSAGEAAASEAAAGAALVVMLCGSLSPTIAPHRFRLAVLATACRAGLLQSHTSGVSAADVCQLMDSMEEAVSVLTSVAEPGASEEEAIGVSAAELHGLRLAMVSAMARAAAQDADAAMLAVRHQKPEAPVPAPAAAVGFAAAAAAAGFAGDAAVPSRPSQGAATLDASVGWAGAAAAPPAFQSKFAPPSPAGMAGSTGYSPVSTGVRAAQPVSRTAGGTLHAAPRALWQ